MDALELKPLRVILVVICLAWLAACAQPAPQPVIQTTPPARAGETSTPLPLISPRSATPTLGSAAVITPSAVHTSARTFFTQPEVITRGEIQDIAASPDGRWLALASASGLYLHDAQTLAYERALLEDVWVSGVAFSPDSRALAVYGKGWLQLLNLEGAQEARRVQASVLKLDFAPDGQSLIGLEGSGNPATLRIWELLDWQERQVTLDAEDAPRSMAVSPDGKILALGGESGWVELFDVESTARLAVLSEWTGRSVTDLSFSPDGSLLAAAEASADGSLQVWSVEGRKKVVEQYTSSYYSIQPFVVFSADGQHLLGGMGDLAVVLNRSSGQQVGMLLGYATFLSDLEVSLNGDRLAYATYNWPAYIHQLEGQAFPWVLSVPYYEAFNVAFSPDGETVAVGLYSYNPELVPGGPAEMVRFLDTGTGAEVQTLPQASAAAFSPDGGQIALADTQGSLRLVELQSWTEICLPGCTCTPVGVGEDARGCSLKLPHDLSPMDISYSPDGKLLAVWGVAGTWTASGLIDLSTGQEAAWFEGGSRISFGPEGLIALGVDELNADHGIAAHWSVLYDTTVGKEVRRVELPATGVAALSPDGKWLAIGLSSFEKTNPTGQDPPDPAQNGLMIWDVSAWRQAAYYPIPYGVTRLAFSPQGDYLVTASETGEILRWNLSP